MIAHGLKSTLDNHHLLMGSRHFLEEDEGIDFTSDESQIREYEKKGRHLIFFH